MLRSVLGGDRRQIVDALLLWDCLRGGGGSEILLEWGWEVDHFRMKQGKYMSLGGLEGYALEWGLIILELGRVGCLGRGLSWLMVRI